MVARGFPGPRGRAPLRQHVADLATEHVAQFSRSSWPGSIAAGTTASRASSDLKFSLTVLVTGLHCGRSRRRSWRRQRRGFPGPRDRAPLRLIHVAQVGEFLRGFPGSRDRAPLRHPKPAHLQRSAQVFAGLVTGLHCGRHNRYLRGPRPVLAAAVPPLRWPPSLRVDAFRGGVRLLARLAAHP